MITRSVTETQQLGEALGRLLTAGDVVCLSGELGAGKTALAAGIGKGFGALETINSPTFVLVHEHRRRADTLRLYHLDCYRLERPADADSLGLEDMLNGDHAVMIEWPERIRDRLPDDCLWIELERLDYPDSPDYDENARLITLQPTGPRAEAMLDQLLDQFDQLTAHLAQPTQPTRAQSA